MQAKIFKSLIFLSFIGVLFLFKKGFENKVDPLWIEVVKIVNSSNCKMLCDNKDKLQDKFNEIHYDSSQNVFDLIGENQNNSIRFSKFDTLVNRVITEKKVMIFHSAGNGVKIITPKLALFVAGKKDRLLRVSCIVNLESHIHNELIGQRGRGLIRIFYPGKLLKFIDKCKQSPNEKFVLLLDDISNIHRNSIFGKELWNNLRLEDNLLPQKIEGYDKDISIPDNLHIISTALHGRFAEVPISLFDYWKLTKNTPYTLGVDPSELKALLKPKEILSDLEKNDLVKQLYFFSKVNDIISKNIGEGATIGQYGMQELISKKDYKGSENLVFSNILNHSETPQITEKDFSNIRYTMSNNGEVKNTNKITCFFIEMVHLGLFGDLAVAFGFAVFSFVGIQRMARTKKKRLKRLLQEADETHQKYLSNIISYNIATGKFLSIEDKVQELAEKDHLSFSQVTYVIQKIQTKQKDIDFINRLEDNPDLANFAKMIIGDDDITKEEYLSHNTFLEDIKLTIDELTYKLVKQQLVRLYNKSNLKFGRVKI